MKLTATIAIGENRIPSSKDDNMNGMSNRSLMISAVKLIATKIAEYAANITMPSKMLFANR